MSVFIAQSLNTYRLAINPRMNYYSTEKRQLYKSRIHKILVVGVWGAQANKTDKYIIFAEPWFSRVSCDLSAVISQKDGSYIRRALENYFKNSKCIAVCLFQDDWLLTCFKQDYARAFVF